MADCAATDSFWTGDGPPARCDVEGTHVTHSGILPGGLRVNWPATYTGDSKVEATFHGGVCGCDDIDLPVPCWHGKQRREAEEGEA